MADVVEKWLGDKKVRLLVKDKNEYLQRYWARGDIYEYDLYGSDPMRRAAGWLFDKVSQRTKRVRRQGMLSYIQDNYRGGTFVDVGSCIGNHTLFFAVGCQATQVLSFEPVPELNRHQRELLDLNNLTNVKLFQCALGDKPGKLRITKSDFTKNAGMSQFDPVDVAAKNGERGEEVDVRTLDSVCDEENVANVKLIKIDVEGFNVPFLKGATKTIEKHRPDIFCECETKEALADVDAYLSTLGYVRHEELVFNLTPTYLFQPRRGS
jgi:FkbM family methyltransferase